MSRRLGTAARDALRRDPARAFRAIRSAREELDEVEQAQVANALSQGWSLARIGRALGISRQAAHRKYASCIPAPFKWSEPLLSANVRVAIVLARTEAAGRRDALVGTEHLLLGLLQEGEGIASEAMRSTGVGLRDLRNALDVISPTDICSTRPSQIGFTSRAAYAIERAAGLAARDGVEPVSDEHLLRTLITASRSGARAALRVIGASPEAIERALDALAERSRDALLAHSA